MENARIHYALSAAILDVVALKDGCWTYTQAEMIMVTPLFTSSTLHAARDISQPKTCRTVAALSYLLLRPMIGVTHGGFFY